MKPLLTLISLFTFIVCLAQPAKAQIGTIKTEEYKASFEKTQSIDSVSNYTDTIKVPIQLLKIGFTEELYEMYPELKEKRVGLGVTNIVIEYLEITNRFVFTVYDFSVSEDEVVKVNGQSKTTQTTRLGLQVKFVDAETGEVIVGSGLGEASTIKTVSILDGIDEDGVKFNQSTIGITTKKALETASSRIVTRLIKKGIFKS